MKALEILKDLKHDALRNAGEIRWDVSMSYVQTIEASIAELEALQEHKVCDGCKYDLDDFRGSRCVSCARFDHLKDYYEPKE